mmetsp:Transcript_27017/g.61992  ORF Transcript_27017/g.61992 Transcript_27017/m.61992 type:complete len:441 (-) Transcript_27017:20-1342(-)
MIVSLPRDLEARVLHGACTARTITADDDWRTRPRLVDVVLDEEGLLDGRLGAWHVLALRGLGVGDGAREELVLGSLVFVVLASPDLNARRLQRTRVGEREREGALAVELVDLVEVDGGILLRDAAREEGDAGHGGGQAAVEGLHGHLGDGLRVGLVLALDARHGHRGLEERALEEDAVLAQLLVHGGEDALLHARGGGDVVGAVDEDLRLDDRDEAALLADARVAREVLRGDLDGEVSRAARLDVDLERRAPLGEARALLVVLLGALLESVEARAPGLALAAARQRLQAGVHLDSGDDAVLVEHVHERLAIRVALEESLLEQNGARDVLADARGGEEEVTPLHAVFLDVLHPVGLEALPHGARGLVAREQALPRGDHRVGRGNKLLHVLAAVDFGGVGRGHQRRGHAHGAHARRARGGSEGGGGEESAEHCEGFGCDLRP